jgi:NADPH:quinone reductase-like Zn-dependent oxidoreductase
MKTSCSVVLPAYNDNLLRAMLSLRTGERTLPALKGEEVLVKMEGAPCNPSDIAFLRGGYNIIKPLPAVPGFEGTGIVVEAGKDSRYLIGKRVSCFVRGDGDGTWADFFVARKSDCILLREGIDWMQASCLAINPTTAWALFERIQQSGCAAFVQNAAGGQVARILQKLAVKCGIRVINIVRKEASAIELKRLGVTDVLHSGDANFNEILLQLCNEFHPMFAFDAVGGGFSGIMLNAMPPGSQLVIYGGLSGEPVSGIDLLGIIFRGKSVTGFNLYDWMASKTEEEIGQAREKIQDLVIQGQIEISFQGTYKLEQVADGLRAYIRSMSAGKVIFIP